MSSTPELTLTEIEAAEFNLVDQISKLPAAAKRKRDQALETLAKLRDVKGRLLAANPDILRKAAGTRTPAEPRWFGLPAVAEEVAELVHAARDRQAERQRLERLAKQSNELGFRELPRNPDDALAGETIMTIKGALQRPMAGDRNLLRFLNRYATNHS
jgi:hypothetical protein